MHSVTQINSNNDFKSQWYFVKPVIVPAIAVVNSFGIPVFFLFFFSPEPKAFHSYVILAKTGNRCWWSLLYRAILRSRADSLRSHVILHEWIGFYSAFFTIHRSGVLTALAWLVPHETAAISARSVYTIQPVSYTHLTLPTRKNV